MACYRCEGCDNLVDDDWNHCTEGPNLSLYCPSCVEESDLFDEEGELK